MQESDMKQHNDRPLQAENCTRKLRRVRCCGRVINEQDADNKRNLDNRGKCMKNGQGQGKRMRNGNGNGNGNNQNKRML